MRKTFVALVLAVALVASTSCTRGLTGSNIVGTYAITGTNSDGSTYNNLQARIGTRDDGSVAIEYFQDGFRLAVGVGLVTGRVLSVITQTYDGGLFLASYHTIGEGGFAGQWKIPGQLGIGTEEWRAIPGLTGLKTPETEQEHESEDQPGIRL